MTNPGWVKEEPGWYTHEILGGISQERDGKWYAYPTYNMSKYGPFGSLKLAQEYIEEDYYGPKKG